MTAANEQSKDISPKKEFESQTYTAEDLKLIREFDAIFNTYPANEELFANLSWFFSQNIERLAKSDLFADYFHGKAAEISERYFKDNAAGPKNPAQTLRDLRTDLDLSIITAYPRIPEREHNKKFRSKFFGHAALRIIRNNNIAPHSTNAIFTVFDIGKNPKLKKLALQTVFSRARNMERINKAENDPSMKDEYTRIDDLITARLPEGQTLEDLKNNRDELKFNI